MNWHKAEITVTTPKQGFHDITELVTGQISKWKIRDGMCYLYLQHTSASLCISENYDPTAKLDLEEFLERIAPENQSWHQHTLEGPDDSPSHMRAIVTGVSLMIPIDDGQLSLGTWQGLYLCEHRHASHRRTVLLRGFAAGLG